MWILQSPDANIPPEVRRDQDRRPRAARRFHPRRALVSRLHCRLTAADDQLEVLDLKSTNGTFVNDKRVEKAKLATGDRLRIGRVELTVERQQSGSMAQGSVALSPQPSALTRNGFVRRSWPMVVSGPCPECTIASSPSGNSTLRIDAISVS